MGVIWSALFVEWQFLQPCSKLAFISVAGSSACPPKPQWFKFASDDGTHIVNAVEWMVTSEQWWGWDHFIILKPKTEATLCRLHGMSSTGIPSSWKLGPWHAPWSNSVDETSLQGCVSWAKSNGKRRCNKLFLNLWSWDWATAVPGWTTWWQGQEITFGKQYCTSYPKKKRGKKKKRELCMWPH